MLEIIRGYSLDTTTGEDLDARAFEYGLERRDAQSATTFVTISDTSFEKIDTEIYSGLSGPGAGSLSVNANEADGFPVSGSIVIGRGTPNVETVSYSSITVLTNYVKFNLSSALAKDHGTDETIVLAQGGNRVISAGTVVYVPEGDISARIDFSTDEEVTLFDGEDTLTGISATAVEAGASSNVPIGAISKFDSLPFAGATVGNPARVTNGKDEETDQELRDRIKDHIQSLSRGTGRAIITNVLGVISETENKRVVSASLVEPTDPAKVVKLYIDDGTGFIPSIQSVGYEQIVTSATGGEKFLNILNVPVVKAFVETQNSEVYNLVGGEDLFVEIGGQVETISFESTDFEVPGSATAQEVLTKINSTAGTFEARLSSDGSKVRIFARENSGEEIVVTGGTANAILNFPTDLKFTTKLYRRRGEEVTLLNKDGRTAAIESFNQEGYDFTQARNLIAIIDGKYSNPIQVWFFPGDFSNPATVVADEVVVKINEQMPGLTAISSSNDTKVALISKTERSFSSKIKIIEDFEKVFNEESGVDIDRTSDASNELTQFTAFADDLDYVYVGISQVKFYSIYFRLQSGASENINLSMEYYDGTIWKEIGFTDETDGLQNQGHIHFGRPQDWIPVSVNGSDALYYIRLRRNNINGLTAPIVEAVRVCSANEIFAFPQTEVVGANRDYTLNRFIGQIELDEPLQTFDELSLGTLESRAILSTVASGNYGLFGGEVLEINIDGVSQQYTLQASDFFTPGDALVSEVITVIDREFDGVFAESIDSGTRIKITGNTFNGGTLQIPATGANLILQFPSELTESLVSHTPAIESGSSAPFTFDEGDNIIVVMDGNNARNYTIPCTHPSSVTGATSNVLFTDTSLNSTFSIEDEFVGFDILFTSGVNVGIRRPVSAYQPLTGDVTLGLGFPATPAIGDTYEIAPKLASHIETLWNNPAITLITNDAEIKTSSGGTKIQIASLAQGEEASVRVTGGTGNAKLNFATGTVFGIDAYRYYTGLAQVTQWTIDGRIDDQENYPGYRAAGVQVEVLEPVKIPISVELDVTTSEGITLTSIINDVKSAVSNYINTLDVGEDVIISEIVFAVKEVSGVFDVQVITPLENIAIADNELPRIDENKIVVG
jgi:uncharacterized phage protein gp47/JayE